MAQLLVKAIDDTHPDPVIDATECWKRGDIIMVREDDHAFGDAEISPMFRVISVPGMTRDDVDRIINPGFYAPGFSKKLGDPRCLQTFDLDSQYLVPVGDGSNLGANTPTKGVPTPTKGVGTPTPSVGTPLVDDNGDPIIELELTIDLKSVLIPKSGA